MRSMAAQLRDQPAEPLHRQLSFRLAREHHEHHPLQLLGVGLVGLEREQPLDHELALLRCDHTRALEPQQQSPALAREPRELAVGEDAQRAFAAGPARILGPGALLPEGEIGEPIERSEERRVGKEERSGRAAERYNCSTRTRSSRPRSPDAWMLGAERAASACFFFQAEDGIRADLVTGVQTCALPISREPRELAVGEDAQRAFAAGPARILGPGALLPEGEIGEPIE